MANETELGSMEHQALMDQFGATLRDLAPALALYYRTLLEAGAAPELAADLTRDFHTLLWRKQFYPNADAPL